MNQPLRVEPVRPLVETLPGIPRFDLVDPTTGEVIATVYGPEEQIENSRLAAHILAEAVNTFELLQMIHAHPETMIIDQWWRDVSEIIERVREGA